MHADGLPQLSGVVSAEVGDPSAGGSQRPAKGANCGAQPRRCDARGMSAFSTAVTSAERPDWGALPSKCGGQSNGCCSGYAPLKPSDRNPPDPAVDFRPQATPAKSFPTAVPGPSADCPALAQKRRKPTFGQRPRAGGLGCSDRCPKPAIRRASGSRLERGRLRTVRYRLRY